jgi:N-ethylmaleimide reductase
MKATTTGSIFEKVRLNGFELNNGLVMAPMTRSRAIGTIPNKLMAEYYAQRSAAGMIITEGTSPSANGLGYARTPGIFSPEQVKGWSEITDAVHASGGKIFLQLMHVGRIAHRANTPAGATTLAPSAVKAQGTMWTDAHGPQQMEQPYEMTAADIQETINDFAKASVKAIAAGFDGVELHGANGYLLEQFLNPNTNLRNDSYGGSDESRSRFVIELAKAVADAIGANKTGVRLSPYNTYNDMVLYDGIFNTYLHVTKELAKLDLLYLHVVDYAARATDEGKQLLREIRSHFPNTLILNGGYTKERAELAVKQDGADLVSFGSSFLANPDLPYRLQNGLPLNVPDSQTFYTADAKGYLDYPFAK